MSPDQSPAASERATAKRSSTSLAVLQRLGRSMMMPIAVLPAAALLLRLGQPDLLGAEGVASWPGMSWMETVAGVVGQAGNALFEAMPLLFAVGVAIGFAKRADGSTALAALVGYLVFDRVTKLLFFERGGEIGERVTLVVDSGSIVNWGVKNPSDVLGGIVIGIVTALLWQRYHRIKLPTWLGFFGGRRFVPILMAAVATLIAVFFGLVWPTVGGWINDLGAWIIGAGSVGAGIYGVINRLLLPLGLHHIVNSIVWFVFGEYTDPETGTVYLGEINRYLAGDPTAGGFLSGFFPVLMFGLPGAALAIWRCAHPSQRANIGSLMVAAALTAFVTGITEPIEYAFIFAAPVLFAVHIVLTGVAMAVLNAIDAHLGFGFSAGAIDLLINATKSNTTGLVWILAMGVAYFFLYYFVFMFLIRKMNLPTPGREPAEDDGTAAGASGSGGTDGGDPARGGDRTG
ncbi:PTS transporter subunit EIIC [Nocardiopsis sp. FIRDI 009]|uniref:PTS transporter subunit EIIC n=1 Tax=Nocardiopsis sp. FIRDI 009 TaxID=714197 RepID=UPI000E2610EA|nr:PTS transporter subunit EIIC [Nocardiopsis sp. FIRDI 009]